MRERDAESGPILSVSSIYSDYLQVIFGILKIFGTSIILMKELTDFKNGEGS